MNGAFGPLNFLRSYVYGVDFDATHEEAMLAQQENTRRVAAEADFLRDHAVRATVMIPSSEQAVQERAATLEQCSDVMRIAVAAETTYVVEETRQLPEHEEATS